MCCNPHRSKLQVWDFPNPPPTPSQVRGPKPAAGALLRRELHADAPPVPPARPSAKRGKAQQTHSAEQRPVPAGKGPSCWDWPRAWQLRETLAISCPGLSSPGPSPPCPAAATIQVPAAVVGSPSLCSPESESMLRAAGWASTASCPSAGSLRPGSGCPAQSVRSARRRRPGRCGLDCARWPRPGGGSAEASAGRSPLPAPRAGACARGARGGGWGAPGESGEERGRGEARAPGSRSTGASRAPDAG